MKNFVVYKSSAGSGKTFTLVKEYLRLALIDEHRLKSNYKRILAVTFTNKAAAEMKSRVLESLHEISSQEKLSFVGALLCKELSVSEEVLKKRAAVVLSDLLHHYSDFSIGTIDSFTHKIVKTFAHDLKLPVNFNIELDTRGFYNKVVASLLNKIGEDPFISKLLTEYVLSKAEENSSWDPEEQIQKFSQLLEKEHSESHLQKLKQFSSDQLQEFRKQFSDFVYYYKDSLKKLADKALNFISEKNLSSEDFWFKKSGPINFFTKCAQLTISLDECYASRLQEALSKEVWLDKAFTDALQKTDINKHLTSTALEIIAFLEKNYAYYCLCDLLNKQMVPLLLLKKIEEITQEQKQEERLVFISEFNQRIFDIINNEPTPFIYERLGERYHHYLLDEFQDTSSLQWQNLLPLLDHSLSNGWFNLVVGDGKQSIYRWRNASVKQFSLLPKVEHANENPVLKERENSLSRNFEERVLDTNFRSAPQIVEFNNSFFEFMSDFVLINEPLGIYAQQKQLVSLQQQGKGIPGYVTIHQPIFDTDELDNITSELILKHIADSIKAGFQYMDICILCRKNYQGNLLAHVLVEKNIPVVSSDSLLLKTNFEINTLLAWLRYLLDTTDSISASVILNYLFKVGKLSQDELHNFIINVTKGHSLFELLKQKGFQVYSEMSTSRNLFDTCIAFIKALDLNDKANTFIRFFLDEVNEFVVLKNTGISAFLEWWEVRGEKASLVMPEGMNAVRIMTIHASKGLEFPVVIIPYCNWSDYIANENWVELKQQGIKLPVAVVNLSKKIIDSGLEKEFTEEQEAQKLDNLNLLYVAFTRAATHLHIISPLPKQMGRAGVQKWIKEYLDKHSSPNPEGFYEWGKAGALSQAHELIKNNHVTLEALQFVTEHQAIQIKSSHLLNSQETEGARSQGILLHWILSKIVYEQDIEMAFEKAIQNGLLSRREKEELRKKISDLVGHTELKKWFRPGLVIKLEQELITESGQVLRPDRVILLENKAVIIDYKTGSRDEKKHMQQLLIYDEALQKMGYHNNDKLLVYIEDLSVVAVK